MSALVDLLKRTMHLGTITFVLVLLAVGLVVIVVRRGWRAPFAYYAAAFVALYLLATPVVAERLMGTLDTGAPPLARAADAHGADTIFVLGAGSYTYRYGDFVVKEVTHPAIFRVIEAARVYNLLGGATVIVSGGITSRHRGAVPESEALRDLAVRVGIPASRIVLESRSHNTHDEALELKRMLAGRERTPFVLVTSVTHMRRSMAAFRAAGLNPVASPAPEESDAAFEDGRWLPSDTALDLSDNAFYEWLALAYYWQQGWLRR